MKYYVYTMNNDSPDYRRCVYVAEDKLVPFANEEFVPTQMEYSGVAIEANSHNEAHQAYNSFSGENDIIWCDEPEVTKAVRRAYDKDVFDNETIEIYVHGIAVAMLEVKNLIKDLAEYSYTQLKKENPALKKEQVYNFIKKKYAQLFEEL